MGGGSPDSAVAWMPSEVHASTERANAMADLRSFAPGRESFEMSEETFIFGSNDYFLYHKYNGECSVAAITFQQALRTTNMSDSGVIHLHQTKEAPINAEIIRSVAIRCGSNIVSVRFGSMALTDKMIEGLLPHLRKLEFLQFDGLNIGSVAARATSMFCRNLKSLRISGCHLITSESCGKSLLMFTKFASITYEHRLPFSAF